MKSGGVRVHGMVHNGEFSGQLTRYTLFNTDRMASDPEAGGRYFLTAWLPLEA